MKSKEDTQVKSKSISKKFNGIGSILIAIIAAFTLRWLLIEAYVIPSGSMLPSLLIHDHIFVNKIAYGVRVPWSKTWLLHLSQPQRNDVVVFRFPNPGKNPRYEGQFFIKRIVGTPGDEILYKDSQLYINGNQVKRDDSVTSEHFEWIRDTDLHGRMRSDYNFFDEQLISQQTHPILLSKQRFRSDWGPQVIPEGHFFVMGDNRDNSNDGRHWGFVPFENFMGKAMFVWLSCEETLPVLNFLCQPTTIRWSRFFHWVD